LSDSYHHSLSSVKKWGGVVEDYKHIHDWFDESKHHFGDFRHRALRHHTQGIAEYIDRFGSTIILSTGRQIPVRWVCEQHIVEDMGYLPSVSDWLKCMSPEPWMNKPRRLSKEVEESAINKVLD
jgi:hypothetical protein